MRVKNKRFRNLIFFIVIILLIFIIGVIVFKKVNKRQEASGDTVVKKNVVVITPEIEREKQLVKVTEDELIFDSNPKYSKDEILVAGILNTAPAGFIRRVVGTIQNGNQYIVETEYAVLTDVFEKVHAIKTFKLTENGVEEINASNSQTVRVTGGMQNVSYTKAKKETSKGIIEVSQMADRDTSEKKPFIEDFTYTEISGLFVEGNLDFEIGIKIELDINKGDIIFEISVYDEVNGKILYRCTNENIIEFEKELKNKKIPNFEFSIEGVPVVITNELQVTMEGETKIEGSIEETFGITSKNISGFRWDSKKRSLEEIKENQYFSEGIDWKTEQKLSGEGEIGLFLHLITKLYDSTGTDIAVGISGEGKAEIRASQEKSADGLNYVGCIDLAVLPKLQGNVLVTFPVIDETLVEQELFQAELTPYWEKHWNSGENWKEELEKVKEENQSDWYKTYTQIVDVCKEQQNETEIYFGQIFFAVDAEVNPDEAGGISEGYNLKSSKLVFYLEDINDDEIPELFIGEKTEKATSILAVYTFVPRYHQAVSVSIINAMYNPEIYLCTNKLLLEGNTSGGKLLLLGDNGETMPMSAFRKGQDEKIVIDTETLDWKALSDWKRY